MYPWASRLGLIPSLKTKTSLRVCQDLAVEIDCVPSERIPTDRRTRSASYWLANSRRWTLILQAKGEQSGKKLYNPHFQSFQNLAPMLYSRVPRQTRSTRTVTEVLTNHSWAADIGPELTTDMLHQFLGLWQRVEDVALHEDAQDKIHWAWEKDGMFSARSAYAAKFAGLEGHPHPRCSRALNAKSGHGSRQDYYEGKSRRLCWALHCGRIVSSP